MWERLGIGPGEATNQGHVAYEIWSFTVTNIIFYGFGADDGFISGKLKT